MFILNVIFSYIAKIITIQNVYSNSRPVNDTQGKTIEQLVFTFYSLIVGCKKNSQYFSQVNAWIWNEMETNRFSNILICRQTNRHYCRYLHWVQTVLRKTIRGKKHLQQSTRNGRTKVGLHASSILTIIYFNLSQCRKIHDDTGKK